MSCRFEVDGLYAETGALNPVLKSNYTWNIIKTSEDIPDDSREIKAIKRAFLKWALVIPVKFTFVPNTMAADITITVANDDDYFKTNKNALAYAYVSTISQPIDLVFNESYNWGLNREIGVAVYDMEIVAIHEIGHVLGLHHSVYPNDVMYPSYQGVSDLSSNDITRMQVIHGKREGFEALIFKLKGFFGRRI